MSALLRHLAAPVHPDEPTGRQWLQDELANPEYASTQPGWVSRLLEWLEDLMYATGAGTSSIGFFYVLGIVAVLVLVILVVRVGPGSRVRKLPGGKAEVFDEPPCQADDYRQLAEDAAAAGRFELAVQNWFRALVRDLQERAVLDDRPGLTADEAALSAASAFPHLGDELGEAARLFDSVSFGGYPATARQAAVLRDLQARVRVARPLPDERRIATAGLQVPA